MRARSPEVFMLADAIRDRPRRAIGACGPCGAGYAGHGPDMVKDMVMHRLLFVCFVATALAGLASACGGGHGTISFDACTTSATECSDGGAVLVCADGK